MAKTNNGLVEYAKAQLGLPYWYGTFGQTATIDLYNKKKAQYPDYYKADDFSSQIGKRVHDCVGLIKGYLWSDSPTSTPKYNASQDKSAKGMYAASVDKGTSMSCKLYPGLLLYKGNTASSIHHVGIYDGNGYVLEAKGHAYGVVKTPYKQSDWPFWSQCPYTEADSIPQEKVEYYPKLDTGKIDQVFGAIGVEDKYIGNVANRKPIAEANGIMDYRGTAQQNLSLIDLAKKGLLKKPRK